MPPDHEARIRAALDELADALIALARESQSPIESEPAELLDVATFARRASIGRSTAWLAVSNGDVRSVKVRGRRLVPASELTRLASTQQKAAPAIGAPGRPKEVHRATRRTTIPA